MTYVIEASEETFAQEVEQCVLPVLVDFWNPGCHPCRMVVPTLEEIAEELDGRAKVVRINTALNMRLAGRFGVNNFPTVILFIRGKAQEILVGVRSKVEYLRHLERASSGLTQAAASALTA